MSYNKVPMRLSEFCSRLNKRRKLCTRENIVQSYELSFDAHYELVTIHPWADGNGRMARLLMNLIQFEFGLIPTKILKEDKEEYIKTLVATRENDDLNIFRRFMFSCMVRNLAHDIDVFCKSTEESREKIISLLSQDGSLSATALAERTGITPKAVEKQLAKLKAEGQIRRIGPDRGGSWEVLGK